MFSRRQFMKTLPGSLAALLAAFWGTASAQQARGRVIILGFDGVEPGIVEAMLAAGELPQLARLRDQGGYSRLASSCPPQSPTAWSSFITCTNPGAHGIYDFLRRDPKTYLPGLGFGSMTKPELAPDGKLVKPPAYECLRKGRAFWSFVDDAGLRCKLVTVPYASPPDDLQQGHMLCGLDIPDIRGTTSTFLVFSDQFAQEENVSGGVKLPLRFDGDRATVAVPGLRHPVEKRFVEVPMQVAVDRAARTVTLDVQGRSATLPEHTWSDWLEWSFPVTPQYTVRAISRVYVHEAGEHVRLYMTCLQVHPKDPCLRISTPPGYSGQIAERRGLFKTVGWAYDTKALQQGELTDDLFLEDEKRTVDWYEGLVLDELEQGQFELLVAGWTATDRIAHMFWRFRDPKHPLYTAEGARQYGRAVEDVYARMDEIVGKVMAQTTPSDLLIVMSDHGFKAFRKAFSVNTWLVRNGYLTVKGQANPASAFTDERFLQAFDWSKTKAYALGLGSLYLNLQGREGQGTVAPGEAEAVLAEIKQKLLAETDPETGEKIFAGVYLRTEVYEGASVAEAPDIQLGYADGYQTDKRSAAGAAPREVLSPNNDTWSAEHAAADPLTTPGVLFANQPLAANPRIIDIGPTALRYLGVALPPKFEGKPLL